MQRTAAGPHEDTAVGQLVGSPMAATSSELQKQGMNPDAKKFRPTGPPKLRYHVEASEAEKGYAAHAQREDGVMVATTFNSLMNSSARCEMGAPFLGLSPEVPVHLGIDNAATVGEGNNIANHLRGRAETKL